MKAGKDKASVPKDMSERAGVSDVASFVAVLVQSRQFGTSIAEVLRVYASEMRDKRVMRAFTRTAGEQGLTPDVLSALGTANLGLGRLGQAERQLREAMLADETSPETLNNLGVVLMEHAETVEAEQLFRRAFALDAGNSVAIRDNLRHALAKIEDPAYDPGARGLHPRPAGQL